MWKTKINKMGDNVENFINLTKEIATQLITLSTILVGISVTFMKDVFNSSSANTRWLVLAWSTFVICILSGLLYLGDISFNHYLDLQDISEVHVGLLTFQFCSFVIATALLGFYKWKMLLSKTEKQ
jgi:hypothetical protein